MRFELNRVSLNFENSKAQSKRGAPPFLFQNLSVQFTGPGLIGILGPSGCGKSTLVRLLAGLQKPSSGELTKPTPNMSFVFQESHLLNWRTCSENVALPLELQNLGSIEDRAHKTRTALKMVSLESSADLYPSQLSGGMKMRVSLARAFITDPQVLFCDEPFSALDELAREGLQVELRRYVEKHKALCFFVTHSLSEAVFLADQIYIFRAYGQLETEPLMVGRQDLSHFRDSELYQRQVQTLRRQLRGGPS